MMNDSSHQDIGNPNPDSAEVKRQDPYVLASAMLIHDKSFILKFLPILILPDIIGISLTLPPLGIMTVEVLKRAAQLTFLYLVARNWKKLLTPQNESQTHPSLNVFYLAGFTLWLLFAVPSTLMLQSSAELSSIFALLLIPACIIWLRYYFYFIPYGLGAQINFPALNDAREITEIDWLSPFKAIASPLSTTALFISLASTIAPDGSLPETHYLTAASLAIFPVLAAYLSIAFGISLLSDRLWHKYGLDPYREARLSTVCLQHERWLANCLRPKNGILLLFLAAMIGSGNTFRAATTPPSAHIQISEITASEKTLLLVMQAQDTTKQFRGLRPAYFRLAGKEGGEISEPPHPVKAWVNGTELDFLAEIPASSSSITLELEFQTDRKAEALVKLEDLMLWYRNVALIPLDLKKAKLK